MSESVRIRTESPMAARDFAKLRGAIASAAREVDGTLDRILPKPHGLHRKVHEAMRYAVFAGGKRLRPFLVLASARLFDIEPERALRAAAAIEAMHTYSLVHDDLPCMDDEATAVLAGDALLTVAFEILSDEATHPAADVRCRLVSRLARAAGHDGMIGGQMIDMEAAGRALDSDQVVQLQRMKTGALFEFCCEVGPILGLRSDTDCERLRLYARDFGLVFQITDDLLDVTGSAERTGKAVGKDEEQGKATLVATLGVDGAREEAARLARRAASVLDIYGDRAGDLRELPLFLLDRDS